MAKVLTKVNASQEGGEVNVCVIEISKKDAEFFLAWVDRVKKLQKEESAFYGVSIWDDSAEFACCDADSDAMQAVETGEVIVFAGHKKPPKHAPQPCEAMTVFIDDYGARWDAIAKHSDIRVESETVPATRLKEIANG